MNQGEINVLYNFGGGAETAVEKVQENTDADVFFIEAKAWDYTNKKDSMSLSVEQAETLVSKLNGMLYDFYDARREN